ncbi:MAG: hypothetical protein K2X81_19670 [Candidatus Obscuribacterales bacterium]|nr:hypothetical protein [Candidatus Obscuribacterales bacterium]
MAPNSFNILEFPEQHARLVSLEQEQGAQPQSLPSFAVPKLTAAPRTTELNVEASKVMALLARERIFLYVHILTFLAINLFGCWVAWTCYTGFIADEVSKTMIAMTPFLFVNSLALLCIPNIKGTRAEISRLKERLNYTRFNIEYGHLGM